MMRLARSCRVADSIGGASSIEFALVAAFLMIPLVLGVYDFGTALWSWMQVGNAARAGAQFINVNGYSSCTNTAVCGSNAYTTSSNSCPSTPTNTFTCAVQGATSLGTNVSVSVGSAYCGCQLGTTYTPQASSPPCSVCSGGATPVTLAEVTATYNYKPIFNYLGFGPSSGFNLSAQATALIY
jgi:Flp pilus assembly protein TadG